MCSMCNNQPLLFKESSTILLELTGQFCIFFFILMPCPSAWTKYCLSGQNICPKLKSIYLHVKWMENDFLAMKKCCPWLNNSFSIHFTGKYMYFFSIGKNFLSGQKIFFQGRMLSNAEIMTNALNAGQTKKI